MILPVMAAEPQLCYLSQGQDYSASCQDQIYGQEISTTLYNSADLYPARYFDTVRNFVGSDVEVSVVKIRLFNSLLAACLIFAVASFDRRRMTDSLIAWLAVIAPVTTYLISSVNTSSWTLIGTSCFALAVIAALKNRRNYKILVAAVLFAIVSLWMTNSSRNEGKIMILLLAFGAILSQFAPKKFNKKTFLFGGLCLPILLLAYNFVAKSAGRFSIFTDTRVRVEESAVTTAKDLFLNNLLNLPRFLSGFFGSWGLGWFELEMTQTTWIFSIQAFVLVTAFALRKSAQVNRLVFALLGIAMSFVILDSVQQSFSKIGNDIQPRYFLPFFLGIVIIAASYKTVRYPDSLVLTVAILSTVANSIALRDTIRRYTTGQDVFISKSLNNPIEWWWKFGPQPETVWLIGTISFAALYALFIVERRRDFADELASVTQTS